MPAANDHSQDAMFLGMSCAAVNKRHISGLESMKRAGIYVCHTNFSFENVEADVVIMVMGFGPTELIILRLRCEALSSHLFERGLLSGGMIFDCS